MRKLREACRAGLVSCADVKQRVSSWIAHAEHANTWRLRQAIFRDGLFDPSRDPDRPPECACCVAAPGTTTRGTYAPLIATGTTQGTATTTTGFVLPARLQAGAECLTGLSGMPQASKGGHD
ncbi:MAG: hypothetical protein F4Y58_01940 [Gammaproteobacteria bacterium]|nr:hypothetical protein [Gammaproteobacteria bacterium]